MKTDFHFHNHGSITLLEPVTRAGKAWVAEHIPSDALRWGRDSVVIEPRYADDILNGIINDGLTVI
jgi:hypothetical protein